MKSKLGLFLGGMFISLLSYAVPPQGIVEIDSKWKEYDVDYGYEGGALWFGDLGPYEGDNSWEAGIIIYLDPTCQTPQCLEAKKTIYEWVEENIPSDWLAHSGTPEMVDSSRPAHEIYTANLGYVKDYYYFPDMGKSHYSIINYKDPLSHDRRDFDEFTDRGLHDLFYSAEVCDYSFDHSYRAMCHKALTDWSEFYHATVKANGDRDGCPAHIVESAKPLIPSSVGGSYEDFDCHSFRIYFGAIGGWEKLLEVEKNPALHTQMRRLSGEYSTNANKESYFSGIASGMDLFSMEVLNKTTMRHNFVDRFYVLEPRLNERWLALWGQIPALQYWETFGSKANGMPVVMLNYQGEYAAVDRRKGKEKTYQKKAALFTDGVSSEEIKEWLTKYYKEPPMEE